ncbi:MAG: hypothetical protein K2I40_04915 [Bifidobacterium castoris]|nr:hypothetical protein [Bifidobacterium castoris]
MVVFSVAAVVMLAILSAFAWPGWAVRHVPEPMDVPTAVASAKPTIDAKALPANASELLKAMPEHVSDFARTDAQATDEWDSSSPLEEYRLTYSTGDEAKDVQVVVGQWASEQEAVTQYNALTKLLEGDEIAAGNVKVNGANAGAYVVNAGGGDDAQATAVWRNDTVCVRLSGPKSSVETVFKLFPL